MIEVLYFICGERSTKLKAIQAIKRFKRFLQIEKGLSAYSIYSYTYDLKKFIEFLSIDNIVQGMRPLHKGELVDIPSNLQYWLRADGPVEFFIWQHNDHELSRFQIILFENFVEWEDGVGIKTGKLYTKKDVDTPLSSEDEFTFQIDEMVDSFKIDFALQVSSKIPESYIPEHVAIIMDGNRRFATELGLSPNAGHLFGKEKLEEVLEWCFELGIKNLTVYAFSTENFDRDIEEVKSRIENHKPLSQFF